MTLNLSEMDLASLSMSELKALNTRVTRAIANYEAERLRRARAELDQKARELGFTIDQIYAETGGGRSRQAGKPKFANPANSGQTWSGRGRKPRWFNEAIAAGHSKKSMEI